ncbi:hypothetical protein Lser_V15G21838 [Lactuca serriola]
MVPKDEPDMDREDTSYTTILNQKRDFKNWQIYSLYQ